MAGYSELIFSTFDIDLNFISLSADYNLHFHGRLL
jgi:hypothetical protein